MPGAPTPPAPDKGPAASRAAPAPLWPPGWLRPAGLALIFAIVTLQVVGHGRLVELDRAVRSAVLSAVTTPVGGELRALALGVCDLANWQVAGAVLAVVAVAVSVRTRSPRPAIVAAGAGGGALAVVVPLKAVIARPGPFTRSGGSGFFPSGHTVTGLVCFGTAAVLIGLVVGPRARRWCVRGAIGLGLLVAVALVWCDYHWVSDVVAGAALGGLLLDVIHRCVSHRQANI